MNTSFCQQAKGFEVHPQGNINFRAKMSLTKQESICFLRKFQSKI